MTDNFDRLMANNTTTKDLISSLMDYHERLHECLIPCLKDYYSHNDLYNLMVTVENQDEIISALHECLEYINNSNHEALQQLFNQSLKDGDKSCN